MALMLWDPTTMLLRPATQADLDELQATRAAYGRLLARFQEDRAMLVEEIKAIRSRVGMPNDLMVDPPREAPAKE